jgi:hypothetical protein
VKREKMAQEQVGDERKGKVRKPDATKAPAKRHAGGSGEVAGLLSLQQKIGNRAVQRLLAQRSGDGPFELGAKYQQAS